MTKWYINQMVNCVYYCKLIEKIKPEIKKILLVIKSLYSMRYANNTDIR